MGKKNSKFAKNFTQIQQVQQIPGTRNMKEAVSRYATVKLIQTHDKKDSLIQPGRKYIIIQKKKKQLQISFWKHYKPEESETRSQKY